MKAQESMKAQDLLEHYAPAWREATRHPFLEAVRDGTLSWQASATWLTQDYLFVRDVLSFQARLSPRYAPKAVHARPDPPKAPRGCPPASPDWLELEYDAAALPPRSSTSATEQQEQEYARHQDQEARPRGEQRHHPALNHGRRRTPLYVLRGGLTLQNVFEVS